MRKLTIQQKPYEPRVSFYCRKCGKRSWISWGLRFATVPSRDGHYCPRCRHEILKGVR